MEHNPWKTLHTKSIYENPWIAVSEHQVINPSGGHGIYGVVHFKNRAIGILPLDQDGYTYLVGQWRYALGEYSWELPEGGGPFEEDPLEAAKRELLEETGLIALSWTQILRMHLSNSVTNEESLVYLATDLRLGKAAPEETEQLQVQKIHFLELLEQVKTGKITDSITVAAVLRVALMGLVQ